MTGVQVLGRQPVDARVTPSNINPWYGAITGAERFAGFMRGGERFTREQVGELERRRIDPRAVEAMTVRRRATMAEAWWPTRTPAPLFEFDCPVVGQRNGKVMVIAPAGVAKLVEPDGWASTAKGRAK